MPVAPAQLSPQCPALHGAVRAAYEPAKCKSHVAAIGIALGTTFDEANVAAYTTSFRAALWSTQCSTLGSAFWSALCRAHRPAHEPAHFATLGAAFWSANCTAHKPA